MATTRPRSEAPAGLFRSPARHSVRPAGQAGDRLPSEADLVRQFGASRITVGRAVRDLQARRPRRAPGRVRHLRQAAGRRRRPVVRAADPRPRRDGDLRADLPGDDGLAAARRARAGLGQPSRRPASRRTSAPGSCAGSTSSAASPACSSRRSSSTPEKDDVNARIARALDEARHPGRPARPHGRALSAARPPRPRRHRQPARRLRHHRAPAARSARGGSPLSRCRNAAATVDAREAGYREALYAAWDVAGGPRAGPSARSGRTRPAVRALMESPRPDAIVCANDRTAARLMRTLLGLGLRRPGRRPPGRHRRRRLRGAAAGAAHHAAAADAARSATPRWRRCSNAWRARPAHARHPAALELVVRRSCGAPEAQRG